MPVPATPEERPGELPSAETEQLAAIDHDDSLILSMLARSPAERLQCHQAFVDGATELRGARKVSE